MVDTRHRMRKASVGSGVLGLLFFLALPAFAQSEETDERVWEDVSYGTGEALFTAIAVDPENPKRLYAGANGAVYVSEDGGGTWQRVLRVRGASSTQQAGPVVDEEELIADEVEDRIDSARDELLEELKQQITDDLISDLGEYGEVLADEIAEELAEQQLAEQEEELTEEVRRDLARTKSSRGTETGPEEELELELGDSRIEPRTIHRILALPKGRVYVATGSGLFISEDAGQSFEESSFGLVPSERDVRSVAVHPERTEVILAGTLAGLYRSGDGGESWEEVGGFPSKISISDLDFDPISPARVLAATELGVYRSVDAGLLFVVVSQPNSPLSRVTRAVAYDPADPRIAFAGTQEGLFRSLDGGEEWERLEPPGLLTRDIQDFVSRQWGLVAASSNGVFVSADSGETFRELYAGLDSQDVRRLAASEAPLEAYAATGRGLFAYRQPAERERRVKALTEMKKLMEREPSLELVAAKAVGYAEVELPMNSWRRRSSLAPLAPRLSVRWNGVDPWAGPFDHRVAGTTFPPTIYNFVQQDEGWTAFMTWDLVTLLFPTQGLDVSRTFRKTEKVRSKVLRRVVNTYNARRRLQVALIQSPPGDAKGYALKVLQVDELSAVLDGLTGGWFSEALESDASRAHSRTR